RSAATAAVFDRTGLTCAVGVGGGHADDMVRPAVRGGVHAGAALAWLDAERPNTIVQVRRARNLTAAIRMSRSVVGPPRSFITRVGVATLVKIPAPTVNVVETLKPPTGA
ncbi:hypothetical protein K1W54_14410, partial [Micromonospora sp. CPCC 205371]|nr:hypothetical protein [Micromonospora sp. CPCC 205371]